MTSRTATSPCETARDVLIAANPRAGAKSRHGRVEAMLDAVEAAGFNARVVTELAELSELAAKGCDGGLRAVVAVGGDGTAAVVRNHVPLEIPLLPVPLGTENLLGRYVDQGVAPAAVVDTLTHGVAIGLDLGQAGDRYFLLMISVGFDAEVIRRLHESRRGNITRLAYIKPTLAALRSYAYPELQLYCDGSSCTGGEPLRCRWAFGFNLPLYACGWQVVPGAVGTDGRLDLCLFTRGTVWSVARYLWHVTRRRHHLLEDATIAHGERFRIEAAGASDVAYQLDGDWAGTLPVEVGVLPGALRLLVSPATARRLGFSLPIAHEEFEGYGSAADRNSMQMKPESAWRP